MAKKEEGDKKVLKVKGFTLVNPEKVDRAIFGAVNGEGNYVGGIVSDRDTGEYAPEALLAEYDRLGGLILKRKDKVKTGSFYNFKTKQPRREPEIVFVYRVNGQMVEVPDGKELPGVVKAAKILAGGEGAATGRVANDKDEDAKDEDAKDEDAKDEDVKDEE